MKLCGMARALEIAGIPLAGTHHRSKDDARNIAKLAMLIFRGWKQKARRPTGECWCVMQGR